MVEARAMGITGMVPKPTNLERKLSTYYEMVGSKEGISQPQFGHYLLSQYFPPPLTPHYLQFPPEGVSGTSLAGASTAWVVPLASATLHQPLLLPLSRPLPLVMG